MGEMINNPSTYSMTRIPVASAEGYRAVDVTAAFNPFAAENHQAVVGGSQEAQPVVVYEEAIPHAPVTEEASIFQQLLDEYVLERKAPIEALTVEGSTSADQLAAWKDANVADVPYADMSLGDLIDNAMANVDRQLAEMKSIISQPNEMLANDQILETVQMAVTPTVEAVEPVAPVVPLDVIRIQKTRQPANKPIFRDEVGQTEVIDIKAAKKEARRARLGAIASKVAIGLFYAGAASGAAYAAGYHPDEAFTDVRSSVTATSDRVQQMDMLTTASYEQDSKVEERKSKVGKFIGKYVVGLVR